MLLTALISLTLSAFIMMMGMMEMGQRASVWEASLVLKR
jgi:hypothetical protein